MITSSDLGIHGIPDAVLKLYTPLKNLYVVIEYKNSERPWDTEYYEEQKQQVMVYVTLLRSVYRTEDVIGYLCYLKEKTSLSQLVPVAPSPDFLQTILSKRNDIASFQHNCKSNIYHSSSKMGEMFGKYKNNRNQKYFSYWRVRGYKNFNRGSQKDQENKVADS